jgi:anaerobic ribonucleoside-triphosphate reductase activating protein
MTGIALSRLHFPIHTLGPGRRVGIWFQGCSIRCQGCVSLDTWAPGKGTSTVEALLLTIAPWIEQADGVTISGGEPFDQPEALLATLQGIRRLSGCDVLIYSGYPLERLDLLPFRGFIDALMSDPFDRMAAQSLPLRGSDNQRLTLLTDKGKERFREYENAGDRDQSLDVMFDDETGEVFFVGIPRPGDMRRFADLLETMGHSVATSEDVRVLL